MLKTYTFDCARDGDLYSEDFVCESIDDAQEAAVAAINANWRMSYKDWDEMGGDMDGCDIIEHEAVMADRQPVATVQLYRRLADGLSDMIEGGRLTEGDIPDDYRWLVEHLAAIAAADPGEPAPIADIRASGEQMAQANAADEFEKPEDHVQTNHYECGRCGKNWTDTWSCGCDDDCPDCGETTSPHESVDDPDCSCSACVRDKQHQTAESANGETK